MNKKPTKKKMHKSIAPYIEMGVYWAQYGFVRDLQARSSPWFWAVFIIHYYLHIGIFYFICEFCGMLSILPWQVAIWKGIQHACWITHLTCHLFFSWHLYTTRFLLLFPFRFIILILDRLQWKKIVTC